MLNNRDEKYEDHEDSEYHFTDDEVSYELDTEVPSKPAVVSEPKANALSQLTNRKRTIIVMSFFLLFVFIIYKFLVPSSSVPSTDITPELAQKNQTLPAGNMQANEEARTKPLSQPANNVPATQPLLKPTESQVATQAAAQAVPTTAPMTTVVPPSQQPPANNMQPQQQLTANTNVPAVPVNNVANATPPEAAAVQSNVREAALSALNAAQTMGTSNAAANTAAENQKLINQLEADYSAKINEFSAQNKALQDQMQVLSSRMAVMETQMNQLVQTLTHQAPPGIPTNTTAVSQVPVAPPTASPAASPAEIQEPKVFYSVQAIIPGRAWLRSDNGETVTVAEGDIIKEFGRVTKIDPYDGVVEINTGHKSISLSYGNGG